MLLSKRESMELPLVVRSEGGRKRVFLDKPLPSPSYSARHKNGLYFRALVR